MNTKFKFDKDIPIPKIKRSGRLSKYPLIGMKVGESFLAKPEKSEAAHALVSRVLSACSYIRLHKGYAFTTRQTPQGVRVWRTA